jgi:hypothetical protein
MVKSLSTLAGIAAIAFAASAGIAAADCFGGHKNVTASVSEPQEGSAMSTFDGQLPQIEEQTAEEAQVAEAPSPATAEGERDQK